MSAKESYLTKPENVRFIRVWRSMWKHSRIRWIDYWNLLCELQRRKFPWKASKTLPESIAPWCQTFASDGTETPLIVGAAAGYRREFVRIAAMTLPGEGIELPRCDDPVEQAIANCHNWENAIQVALANVEQVKGVISRARPEWNISSKIAPIRILDLLENEFEISLHQLEEHRQIRRKRIVLQPLAESGFMLGPADRINKATIEAFAYGAMERLPISFLESLGADTTFWLAHAFGKKKRETSRDYIIGAIGFREKPGDHIQRFLQKNGALAIKAQYALWARAYAETDAAPGIYITLTIPQFCDDMGMARRNRAHKLQSKRAALEVLELLTSMELVCIYQPPTGPVQRIRGPIWSRGMISEELRGYEDVFESGSVSNRPLWVPKAFSYAPGPFFANEAWRAYNPYIALVAEGLLRLNSNNSDKYAVMIGGYLAILARMNGYRRSRLSVRTLLEKTGLWAVDSKKNPGRMRKKLEDSLDRLCEVGVIEKWEITSSKEDIDPDNLDDAHTLEHLAEPTRWLQDWVRQVVIVDWPALMKERESVLQKRRERHIKEAARRHRRASLKIA